jgi:PTS system nitrogen regulatory IIA component
MPYRRMTIQDVAQILGDDVRRVHRMADRGKIPCQKVGGQFRFNRAEITEWLQQHMTTMPRDDLAQFDAAITTHRQVHEDEAIVAPLLRVEAVAPLIGSRTKSSALRELVALATRTGMVYDDEALLEAVQGREALSTTALEGGIAIPHPHRPLPYALAGSILVVARAGKGLVFGARDGELTDLLFLTASQDDHHHLHLLARLCRMLGDRDWVDQLRDAETAKEIVELMARRERDVLRESG